MACRQRTGEAILHPYGDDRSRQGPAVERFPVHPQQDGLCRRACATWDFPLHRGRHERAAACRTMRHRSPRGWPCLRGLPGRGLSPARPARMRNRPPRSPCLGRSRPFGNRKKEKRHKKREPVHSGQAPRVFALMAAVASVRTASSDGEAGAYGSPSRWHCQGRRLCRTRPGHPREIRPGWRSGPLPCSRRSSA